jgi:hypothetical protein
LFFDRINPARGNLTTGGPMVSGGSPGEALESVKESLMQRLLQIQEVDEYIIFIIIILRKKHYVVNKKKKKRKNLLVPGVKKKITKRLSENIVKIKMI